MIHLPTEPMLAAPAGSPRLSAGWAAEPKWDGVRAVLGRESGGRVRLRSRRGTDLSAAFPELVAAAAGLPAEIGDVVVDGEIVIWDGGRLDFRLLLRRLGRRASSAAASAREHPAHFVVFDLLQLDGRDLAGQPYRVRRAELEAVFACGALAPPWTLCPSTTDPDELAQWLVLWPAFGVEGAVFKRLDQSYLPGRRGWLKWRARDSVEAVVAAVAGSLRRPAALLLGVPDGGGLRYLGRTGPLDHAAAAEMAGYLDPAGPGHPWRRLAGESGVVLVDPVLVVEVAVDASLEPGRRWRHPARYLRPRPDLGPAEVSGTDPSD